MVCDMWLILKSFFSDVSATFSVCSQSFQKQRLISRVNKMSQGRLSLYNVGQVGKTGGNEHFICAKHSPSPEGAMFVDCLEDK